MCVSKCVPSWPLTYHQEHKTLGETLAFPSCPSIKSSLALSSIFTALLQIDSKIIRADITTPSMLCGKKNWLPFFCSSLKTWYFYKEQNTTFDDVFLLLHSKILVYFWIFKILDFYTLFIPSFQKCHKWKELHYLRTYIQPLQNLQFHWERCRNKFAMLRLIKFFSLSAISF